MPGTLALPLGFSASPIQILAKSAVAVSCPADTTEDTLATITVPAGAMGANGWIRVSTLWAYTNNANGKFLRVRFGGSAGTQYMLITGSTNSSYVDSRVISNTGTANSQVGPYNQGTGGSGFGSGSLTTSAVDTTATTTIVITGQKAVAGDTLTLQGYLVELMYGA